MLSKKAVVTFLMINLDARYTNSHKTQKFEKKLNPDQNLCISLLFYMVNACFFPFKDSDAHNFLIKVKETRVLLFLKFCLILLPWLLKTQTTFHCTSFCICCCSPFLLLAPLTIHAFTYIIYFRLFFFH